MKKVLSSILFILGVILVFVQFSLWAPHLAMGSVLLVLAALVKP
jgi:hypothetical protein